MWRVVRRRWTARSFAPRWGLAIFVAVFGLYLLSSGREPAWGDAHSMWDVAERICHGSIDITTRWPRDLPPGRDGKIYGIAPIGPSLVDVPGVVLRRVAHHLAPADDVLFRPIFTHLGCAALGALACVLFFGLLRDLGRDRRAASVTTAILAVATTTWVYARYPYSEILQLVCFLGWFRQVLRTCDAPTRREALWLGAWAGMLLDAKYVFALPIATGLALVAWCVRARRRELMRVAGWAASTALPFVALALWYNWARWGSVTRTGYEPYLGAFFGGSAFDGAWGMLASPNKSALLYSPPLVLALWCLPRAIRDRPRLGLALAAMVVPTFLVYCTYRSWSGDYAWGPRFFVWAVPVLLVPLAWFVERLTRARRLLLAAVVAAGVSVQLLGNALYWDHFIRIAITVKNQWLGQPNRRGAYIAARGRGSCDSCFEDTYELLWLPPFQQIRGHWWLVKSLARGDDAVTAQDDAPWRTYTTLRFDLSNTYPRARLDWWGMLWLRDARRSRLPGELLLVAFAALTGGGLWMWLRLHRRAADP